MNTITTIKCLAAGLILFAAAGCCQTTAKTAAVPGPVADGPATLYDGLPTAPEAAPEPVENRKLTFSQVEGDLVYNLGQGVVANSSSVLLAGGLAKPRSARLPGGVEGCCPNPLPQVYLDAVRNNRALSAYSNGAGEGATVMAVQPVGGESLDWETEVFASGRYGTVGSCPVYPESQTVCQPGDNLSDCYTLPGDEAAPAQLYIPHADAPLEIEELVLESVDAAGRGETLESPPAVTERAPVAVVEVEVLEVLEAVSAAPVAGPVAVMPEEAARSEVSLASDPAAPVSRSAAVDIMPPVPAVADFDAAIDAILNRDGGGNGDQAPEIQLPPQLR